MSIIIRKAMDGEGRLIDLLIKDRHLAQVVPSDGAEAKAIVAEAGDEEIDATGKAVIPGLVNCHTHAAMTYFRGYGDDLDLMDWLENMIWPVEALLTKEDIYWGSKLACLEMIKSGTTTFLDMYSFPEATAQAVEESGLRAVLSYTMFDRGDAKRAELDRERCYHYYELFGKMSDRIQFAVGPHAIYTVSGSQLQFAHQFAKEHNCLVNLHLAETYVEWQNATRDFGMTPVRYLNSLGILSPNLVLAHSLWMDSEELQMLADNGCCTVHNPASNMKLASGYHFRYHEMQEKGITVGLGTDGCSSSNNLDMVTAMKLASFLGKAWRMDPKAVKATEIMKTATADGAKILRIDAGELKEGMLADLCLIDLKLPEMTPLHNVVSNLVYSANGSCVDTTIVDGRILMRNRHVEGEEEIIKKGQEVAMALIKRSKERK